MPTDISLIKPSKVAPTIEEYRDQLLQSVTIARQNVNEKLEASGKKTKEKYDENAVETSFQVGDKVMINKKSKTKGLSPKLSVKYQGPYILKDKLSPVLFRVTNERGKVHESPIHVNRMKKITDRATFEDVEETERT